MTEKQQRVPVSVRAVIQRINRRLKKDGQKLVCHRGWLAHCQQRGKYYVVSTTTGRMIEGLVDLEKLARREHALELWEELETKEGDA